jgi:hypothetical protein
LQVVVLQWRSDQLVDDGQEIVERGDRCQRWRTAGSTSSPPRGEQECSVDGLERDAAIVESGGETAVCAAGDSGRSGSPSVKLQHTLGVALAR